MSDGTAAAGVVADVEAAGGRAVPLALDTTDERSVEALFTAAAERLGPLANLVNNAAAITAIGRLEDNDPRADPA